MRALCSIAPGDWKTLEICDLPAPSCGAGEVRVRVACSAVNYPDALLIEDRYQFRPERPFAPGCEISGTIIETGEGVEDLAAGMRVLGVAVGGGGMAEEIVLPATNVVPIPDDVPFDVAAALILTYGTVWHGLVERGNIKPGHSLLVLGAAGGVGSACIELGKALGARVVAGVSSEEKAQVARKLGADDVLIYPRAPLDKDARKALGQELKKLAPNGFDLVFDPLGGDYVDPALRAIGWQGRYLVVGFLADIGAVPMNLLLLKGCDMVGVFYGDHLNRNAAALREHAGELFNLCRDGKIAPLISARFPLEEGGKAIAALAERKAVGKVVVTVSDQG
ncbi:MAG: NADPH:quinone oxidoreductase family protein [Novosphingobium sp.]|nr:NADPH:quinone oxidoreductase family protein [Novosphingobium sp.]